MSDISASFFTVFPATTAATMALNDDTKALRLIIKMHIACSLNMEVVVNKHAEQTTTF